jgi:hypothetical protein
MQPASRPRLESVVAFVWIVLILGIAIHAHIFPWAHTVYEIYGPAARKWWAGRDLYARDIDYFRYSPLAAISFTPFAMLADAYGNPLWKVVNCAFFAVGLATWARRGLPTSLDSRQRAWIFLLVLPLSLHSMYIGQANLFMLGAILLSLAAGAEERWNACAAWLAAATLIKGYPLALGMLLSVLCWRQFLARYTVALALGCLLPFATRPPSLVASQYASWVHHLRLSTGLMRERLRSIDHLLRLYHHPITPATFAKLGLVSGVIVLGLSLLAFWRLGERRQQLTWVFSLFAV